MTEWEAVEKRISCRAFEDRMPGPEILAQLEACVGELNRESGLRFQLIVSGDGSRPAVRMSPAMFSGPVYVCAALVAGDSPAESEKLGYYGEKLVLRAVELGLGTCWVASTYDAASIHPDIAEGERLWDVIPMGYAPAKLPMKQSMTRAMIRKRDRKTETFLDEASDVTFAEAPDWIRRGIEAVRLGPSAVNQQPVNILVKNGEASMVICKKGNGLEYNDMGIAKRQFEIGAADAGVRGRFEWGNGGRFVREV